MSDTKTFLGILINSNISLNIQRFNAHQVSQIKIMHDDHDNAAAAVQKI